MKDHEHSINALFVDIGEVLLTNGWGHDSRKLAAEKFAIDLGEMEDRHHLNFETFENGKLTLEEYLSRVVFYQPRPFTGAQFREFMFAQSKPYPEMIALVMQLKTKFGLKVVVVSNESRELNAHRIRTFKLNAIVDAFVSSCYIHIRKPDKDIFTMALDIAQVPASQVVFIDDTPMFIHVAEGMGIQSVLHTDFRSTIAKLALLGLLVDADGSRQTGGQPANRSFNSIATQHVMARQS